MAKSGVIITFLKKKSYRAKRVEGLIVAVKCGNSHGAKGSQ